jgi:hypothetical protein
LIFAVSLIIGFFAACVVALVQWWRGLLKYDPDAEKQLEGLKRALVGLATEAR